MDTPTPPPTQPQEDNEVREVVKERWGNILSLLDPEEEEDLESTCGESCSSFSRDDDDDDTVEEELEEIQEDLDYTADSLADLELEFAEDLEALAQGLESAFENFRQVDFDVDAALEQDEQRMSASTRSNFRNRVESTLKEKRNLKVEVVESPRGVDAFPYSPDGDRHEEEDNEQEEVSPVTPPKQPQQQLLKKEDVDFENWFDKFWKTLELVIEQHLSRIQQQRLIQQHMKEKKKRQKAKEQKDKASDDGAKVKSFLALFHQA